MAGSGGVCSQHLIDSIETCRALYVLDNPTTNVFFRRRGFFVMIGYHRHGRGRTARTRGGRHFSLIMREMDSFASGDLGDHIVRFLVVAVLALAGHGAVFVGCFLALGLGLAVDLVADHFRAEDGVSFDE